MPIADRYFVDRIFGGYEVDIPPMWVRISGLRVESATLRVDEVWYDTSENEIFVLFSGTLVGEGIGIQSPFPTGAEIVFSAPVDGWLTTPRDPHRLGEWNIFEFKIVGEVVWAEEA